MTGRTLRSGLLTAAGPALAVAIWVAFRLVAVPAPTDGPIVAAFDARRSDVVVEDAGVVVRTLRDDTRGSRHQRFVVEVTPGHTVLISHNIDLAPRIDGLTPGDRVTFRGEYEWNERGGVVHWTHHDPRGRRPGGWIRHEGREYR